MTIARCCYLPLPPAPGPKCFQLRVTIISLRAFYLPGRDFSLALVYTWWVYATVSEERAASMFIVLPIVVSITGGSIVLRNVFAYVLH